MMDTAQYVDELETEKGSLDPDYHPHAIRLLSEGKQKYSFYKWYGLTFAVRQVCRSMPHAYRWKINFHFKYVDSNFDKFSVDD